MSGVWTPVDPAIDGSTMSGTSVATSWWNETAPAMRPISSGGELRWMSVRATVIATPSKNPRNISG